MNNFQANLSGFCSLVKPIVAAILSTIKRIVVIMLAKDATQIGNSRIATGASREARAHSTTSD